MSEPLEPPPATPPPATTAGAATPAEASDPPPSTPDRRGRPLIERIGMAAIAVVMGALFGVVAVAAFIGDEPFLGVMGVIGALMVLWAGGLTLIRG